MNLSLHNYTTFANVLALPLTPLIGIVAAFNVIYIFNVALTGFAMCLLAREVIGRHPESWLAGALFTASPMLIARGTAHFSARRGAAAAVLPVPEPNDPLSAPARRDVHGPDRRLGRVLRRTTPSTACCSRCSCSAHTLQVRRPTGEPQPRRIKLVRFVDVLIVIVGGFIAGMTIRGGGPMVALGSMIGVRLSMRTLYTPMLIVSCLVGLRLVLALRPRIRFNGPMMPSGSVLKAAAIGVLRCCCRCRRCSTRSANGSRPTAPWARRSTGAAARRASICWRSCCRIRIIRCGARRSRI